MNQRSKDSGLVPDGEWYKYKVSKSMASFANEHFELYLLGMELQSNILKENPLPYNAHQVKKLDDFTISILKDRCEYASNELINQDKVFEKMQVKIRDILEPLCQLWDIFEEAANSNEQSVNTPLDDMQKPIEQTVLMVSQSSNTVTYHRRYNLLNNLMGSSNQAKEAFREKKDLLQKHDRNFPGNKFTNNIVEVTKRTKTTIEVFSTGKLKFRSLPSSVKWIHLRHFHLIPS